MLNQLVLQRPWPNIIVPGAEAQRCADLRRRYVRDDSSGCFLPEREHLLLETTDLTATPFQQRLLAWLRDHVNPGIPRAWYMLVLGHDLHMSTWATLHAKHWHATERNPWTDEMGWLENIGLESVGKVTSAFRDLEALMLVTDSTVIGDFKYHEMGTGTNVEDPGDTALQTTAIGTSMAARASTGTQVNTPAANNYQSVCTVSANGTATWTEHGVFNASTGPTLMDRSILGTPVPVVNTDTLQVIYTLTKNSEA
jgi:hypothetical protein